MFPPSRDSPSPHPHTRAPTIEHRLQSRSVFSVENFEWTNHCVYSMSFAAYPDFASKTLYGLAKHSMLVNGLSVERTDLAPSPGLILHGVEDKSPALWRVYMHAPYVVQNGLPCELVLWCMQPPLEDDYGEEGDSIGPSTSGGGRGSRSGGGWSITPRRNMARRMTISNFG